MELNAHDDGNEDESADDLSEQHVEASKAGDGLAKLLVIIHLGHVRRRA